MTSLLAALTGWDLLSSMPATASGKRASSAASTWSFAGAAATVFWTTTLVKLLCMPFYRSTDFDVHRNWLALTHSLPMREWYFESTSQWTLDYPPAFALFEYVLSFFAKLFDPAMLVISAASYQSAGTVLFQRLSVIVSDVLLFYAILQSVHAFVQVRVSWAPSFAEPQRRLTLLILCFCNPGLIMLDHIHFQYNGFLLGIFLLSITSLLRGSSLWGSFWFALLLQFKHIFLYVAPVYFVFLLFGYCMRRSGDGRITGLDMGRLAAVGSVVVCVSALSLGPFIAWGQGSQLLSRLFPFQRGLCHAYWAPNVWVMYNALDRALVFVARRAGSHIGEGAVSTSSGLVEEIAHVVLPTIKSEYTFVLTVAAMAPVLIKLAKRPHPAVFLAALNYCSLCSFMLGWHVHEKALLLTILPLGLSALDSVRHANAYAFLAVVGHYSLFPLLFQSTETPLKLLLFLLFTLTSLLLLSDYHRRQQAARRIEYVGLFHWTETAFLLGLVPLYVTTQLLLPRVLPSMEFLPLLLTSLYCTLGTMHAWRRCYQCVTHTMARVEDQDEHEH